MLRWSIAGLLAVVLLIGGCTVGAKAVLESSHKEAVFFVENKESIAKDSGHQYRVYTDKGVYQVADSLLLWDWRAADRYNAIKPGTRMICDQYGWRVGFLSMFPNLFNCRPA